MTQITDTIWIGNSEDEELADLRAAGITAVLNVAHDMQGTRGWRKGIVYAQCGLVDGPGSTMAAYHSAVLQLLSLVSGGRKTLVVDHEGRSRAWSVVIMARHARAKLGWLYYLDDIANKMNVLDYQPHDAHRTAFDKMNWRLIASITG